MKTGAITHIDIDFVVESPLWKARRNTKAILRRAVAAAAAIGSSTRGEIAIVLTDVPAVRNLNRRWRGKDEATNVLSFPAHHPGKPTGAAHEMPQLLGDVVIAYE